MLQLLVREFPPPSGRGRSSSGLDDTMERLAALSQVFADPATAWSPLIVPCWYEEHERAVEVARSTAVWYHSDLPITRFAGS